MKFPSVLSSRFSSSSAPFARRIQRALRYITPLSAQTGGSSKSDLAKRICQKVALFAPMLGTASAALAQTQGSAPVAEPQMHWWQGVILGLVQGLTEFIPVSSSGHLNITHWLMGQPRELTYDVFLHIGTLVALIFYFRRDWKELLTEKSKRPMLKLVLLACVPAAIVGALLRHLEDNPPLSEVWFNAAMMIIAGAIMYIADLAGRQTRDMENISAKDALIIGGSQALALLPGVSRSGSTLTAGLFLGLKRGDAARFSFLMSLPITLGAVGFEFLKFVKEGNHTVNAGAFTILIGILASGASGFWAINFLLNYLKTKNVLPFFAWRVVVAVFVFALLWGGHK